MEKEIDTPAWTDYIELKKKRFYDLLDFNKDGIVTEDDMVLIADRAAKIGNLTGEQTNKSKKDLIYIYRTYFAQDGKPSTWEDFKANAMKAGVRKKGDDCLTFARAIFRALDVNCDGVISEKEFVNFYLTVGIDKESALKIFEMIDINKDRTLSLQEFSGMMHKHFTSDDKTCPSKHFWGPWKE